MKILVSLMKGKMLFLILFGHLACAGAEASAQEAEGGEREGDDEGEDAAVPGAQGGHHDRHHHGRLPPLLDALLHRQRDLRAVQGLHIADAFQGTL